MKKYLIPTSKLVQIMEAENCMLNASDGGVPGKEEGFNPELGGGGDGEGGGEEITTRRQSIWDSWN